MSFVESVDDLFDDIDPTLEVLSEAETSDEDSELPWTRWQGVDLPHLPKMSAVRRAYEAARDPNKGGLPDEFAWSLANAAVDPSEVRSAVGSPRTMPVVGGEFKYIDVDLFVPAVAPLMTNHRAVSSRTYPASGITGNQVPLRGPISAKGEATTLTVKGASTTHVADQAAKTAWYVLKENKLRESIADRGILMPVEVVNVEVIHEDGSPTASLLCTAEGSSRITNAHQILELTEARQVLYDLPADNDLYRRLVSQVLGEDPEEEGISRRESQRRRARRNALIVRARVILRYLPAGQDHTMTYAEALASYVGLIHVEGPKQWEKVGKNEAVVEGVLRALEYHSDLDEVEIEYLSGLLDPEQALLSGFPSRHDEQASQVLARLLAPELKSVVSRGIRDTGVVTQVRDPRRTEVVAELALRPTRGLINAADSIAGQQVKAQLAAMSASYRRSAQWPQFRSGGWAVSGRSPEELLAASDREYAEESTPGPASTELAALGMYHLTHAGALSREAFGARSGEGDVRGPQTILEGLLNTPAGRRQLCQAIIDGRAQKPIRAITPEGALARGSWSDDEGYFQFDPNGPEKIADAAWLRQELVPDTKAPHPKPTVDPETETPAMRLERLTTSIVRLSSELEATVQHVRDVSLDNGTRVIEQSGWPCRDVITRLNRVRDDLVFWDRVGQAMVARPAED